MSKVKSVDNPKPYGLELIIDLKKCDFNKATREDLLKFFIDLCEQINMKRHGDPLFWEDWSRTPHLHGISAIQFIETSNVVCHWLPLLKAVYLNIFSCKEFDINTALEFSKKYWKAKLEVHTVITRT